MECSGANVRRIRFLTAPSLEKTKVHFDEALFLDAGAVT